MLSIEYLKKKLNMSKNVKLRDIRLIDRYIKRDENFYPEIEGMDFGSVWSMHDSHVSFGSEERNFKNVFRPVLIVDNKQIKNYYGTAEVAPGTSKIHKQKPTVLIAKVPPENLRKTTFFLIHFKWNAKISLIKKRLTELSPSLKNKLKEIIDNYYG